MKRREVYEVIERYAARILQKYTTSGGSNMYSSTYLKSPSNIA